MSEASGCGAVERSLEYGPGLVPPGDDTGPPDVQVAYRFPADYRVNPWGWFDDSKLLVDLLAVATRLPLLSRSVYVRLAKSIEQVGPNFACGTQVSGGFVSEVWPWRGRDLAEGEGNRAPRGIWSDRTTAWVSDSGRDRLFAYDLETGDVLGEYPLDATNDDPRGIWSDGVTVWISDHGVRQPSLCSLVPDLELHQQTPDFPAIPEQAGTAFPPRRWVRGPRSNTVTPPRVPTSRGAAGAPVRRFSILYSWVGLT